MEMKDLQSAMADAGFTLTDEAPVAESSTEPQVAEQTTEQEPQPVPQEGVQVQGPEEVAQPEPATTPQSAETNQVSEPAPELDVDQEVFKYLSEKLGYEVSDFDELKAAKSNNPVEIDERVSAINDFVQKTGRSPNDWYRYQQLDPSDMDDLTAVRNQMIVQHGNLSTEEVNLLLSDKYKLDEDRFDENEVSMSKLRLKMDAESARKSISELRDGYMLPESGDDQVQSPINEEWVNTMTSEVKEFDGLIFELPTGENFTYGVNDDYRKTLIEKNSNIENFFGDYVHEAGDWNFEKLNAHRAVIDNIDSIVRSVYQQGVSDGQKKVVTSAANISSEPTQRDPSQQSNGMDEQILNAFGGKNTVTFKI